MPLSNSVQQSNVLYRKRKLINKVNWLYIIYSVIFASILRYTFIYWILICSGFLSCIGILLYWALITHFSRPSSQYKRSRKFNFINQVDWNLEIEQLSVNAEIISDPTVEESFLISETLDDMINLVIKEFIDGWFQHISSNRLFQDSVKVELKFVLRNLKERIAHIDFANFLVSRILPIFNEHFQQFIKAEDAVRMKANLNKLPLESVEFNIAVARQYDRGKIHSGVTITNNAPNDINEKKYLRKRIGSILPYLLSSNENSNEVAMFLVREILACTILSNISQMLGEGDFYNLLIVKLIGDNLKHRDQVKQLRAALEQHTQQLNHKPSIRSIRAEQSFQVIRGIENSYIVKEYMDNGAFKEILKNVSKINTIDELKQLRFYVLFQLNKLSNKSKTNSKNIFGKRLRLVKSTINERLLQLASPNDSANYILNEKKIFQNKAVENLVLLDILNNSLALKSFHEFMKYRNRTRWLELWQSIDLIKAPLEDSTIGEDGESRLELSLEFSSLEDIKMIYDKFFNQPDFGIDDETTKTVKEFVECKSSDKLELYQKSRKLLFKLQSDVYQKMNERDFPSFKRSELFLKLIEIDVFKLEKEPSNVVESLFPSYKQLDDYGDSEVDDVTPVVVKAVQDAFTEIMMNSHTSQENMVLTKNHGLPSASSSMSDFADKPLSTLEMKKDLFGDTSSLFGDESTLGHSNNNRYSKLFDDVSEESGTDSDSVNFDSDSQLQSPLEMENSSQSGSQIFLAGPGNLSLSEEIAKLTEQIDKLSEQQEILAPLIRKAEITNNVGELKILRKSKISLDREISAKELQKQQYIVQENDNSLYGKSRVCIQSYISGNEKGKEFILYIVEVQKFSNDEPDIVTAGWIVARRFSQFFKLNEYLKSKYPQVATIKFPKRTMSVLKFQQKQLVELRKTALEEYLQELIKIPEVCSNKAFRSFLSSENFNLRKNQPFDDNLNISYNQSKRNVELVANKLYNGISNRLMQNPLASSNEVDIKENREITDNLKDMQKELKQFDEVTNNDMKPVFVKPICDLLISVFQLNTSKSWLRGRALLVILQQIFGTTIEKKVYESVETHLRTEENLLDILILLKDILFPNGKFKDPPVLRSMYEQSSTKQEAKMLLGVFMNETCSKIFGLSNTNYACSKLFGMIQNDYLNKHIIFELLDELMNEIFPELAKSI